MAYRVTKIVYASHPNTIQAGGVPHQQTLLIFGSEGIGADVLLWQGYRVPITPSEWEGSTSGGVTTKSWGGSFTQGYGATSPDQLKDLSPVDTATPSVSANIRYNSASSDGYVLTFTYAAPGSEEAEEYTVYLGNYVNSEIRLCTPRKVGETQIYQTYDFVPAEVGISNDGSAESSAEYGTTASYRRAVVNECVILDSFDVQLTGPKEFTATYSGRCYLDDKVHSSITDAISFRLYVTELDANGDAVETGSYGLPVTASNGNTEFSGSLVLTDIANQIDYDLATKYKFYIVASIDAAEAATSAEIQRWTQRKLNAPSVSGWLAQDGAGYVSWGAVENAAGYEIAVVDSATATPVSGTSATSPWNFNETNGTAVQDRYVRLMSVAVSNQYEYANSEWSAGVLITGTRTPDEEEHSTPVEINMTRRIYKAIPYVDVPVEQIGANGSSPKDVITVEYADLHYVQSGGEIPASQLPIATSDDLGAIKVGAHLSIVADTGVLSVSDTGAIASGNTGLVTGGTVYAETHKYAAFADKSIATSVTDGNTNPVTSGAVYTFVTTVSNLPKAKAAGGSGNAGVVYVTNANEKEGLIIDGTNAGQIKVDFATYSSWSSTVANKVVNPAYVKAAIEGYVADTDEVTSSGGSTNAGKLLKLNANGYVDSSAIPSVAITDTFTAANKAAMLALSDAEKGDICIRTDENKCYILAENGYATEANWKELKTPTDAVLSVNGKKGTVTLALTDIYASGYTTSVTSGSNALITSGAVYTALAGKANSSHTHTSANITDSIATAAGVTDEETKLVQAKAVNLYVTGAINDLGLGDASKKGVADSVAAGNTDLVTSATVYTYVTGLDASDFGAAPASHKHALSDITYSGTTGYSAGMTISTTKTSNNDGQLATTLAVYNFVSTNYAAKTHTHTSANVTDSIDTAAGITTSATGLVQGKAVYLYVSGLGLGDASKKGVATSITSSEAGLTPGSVVFNYAAPKTHTHTSSQISDAISTVSDPSATSTFGKVVKTESSWGQIGAKLVPIDENSLEFYTSGGTTVIQISDSYVNSLITNKGYITATTAANTYARKDSMFPTWTAGTSYAVGDVVWYNNTLWKCHTANTAVNSVNNSNIPSENATIEGYTNCWTSVNLNDLFGGAGRYTGTITGDGTTTEFTVTHGLGVKDVDVTLIDNNTDQEVFAAVAMYSATQVKIGFGAAPESGKTYRVVVRK